MYISSTRKITQLSGSLYFFPPKICYYKYYKRAILCYSSLLCPYWERRAC